ncbi:hypothetical protein C6500_00265 [Candidatus Poribacteria bacterium]|nr:MAG: hypothetical protein C6500_00265 [Candidatus Poribacteria bacterium]
MANSDRTLNDAVPELFHALPNVESKRGEHLSRFLVEEKVFAYYALNHHGDQRVALWLNVPKGSQRLYLESGLNGYFVPPYVGHKGYLGVELNKDIEWATVEFHVREAYANVSRTRSVESLEAITVDAPQHPLEPAEIDLILRDDVQQLLNRVREICFSLPEVVETKRFGNPAFLAGKKTFVLLGIVGGRVFLEIWVGRERQVELAEDENYMVPKYTGHNGWIVRYVDERTSDAELRDHIVGSYRHFALKRMLKLLPDAQ